MDGQGDEVEIWLRARGGDGAAFAALFDLHHARIYRRALGLLGSIHDAEEVAAAAFFELWRRRSSVHLVNGSVVPWLLVTTTNLSRNVRRRTIRYRRLLRDLASDEFPSGADFDGSEISQRLASSLGRLSPVDGALFVLTVLEGVSITRAAEAVGLKASTARVRLHRARVRLREELDDVNPSAHPATEGSES
ncbi:MAG TPA: RNA polymerase sigma factor [Galbitalea sp.]|nr:RNA polymerase sigma factor [Galbitalea sp.]